MKCQSLFSEKNKKNTISLSSAEFPPRMVKVRMDNSSLYLSGHIYHTYSNRQALENSVDPDKMSSINFQTYQIDKCSHFRTFSMVRR